MLDHPYSPSSGLPYLVVFVEALRAIGWPLAIVLAVWWVRRPIQNLFPRIRHFKAAGVELSLESAKESQIAKTEPKELDAVGVVANLEKSGAIRDGERRVLSDLEKFPQEEHKDLLVNALAVSHLEKHFAFVYINIFGSQIRALQKLNESGGRVTLVDAEAGFNEIKDSEPELEDWTLSRYTAYLEANFLVERSEDWIKLTDVGRDFIQFLVRYGLSTQKPL